MKPIYALFSAFLLMFCAVPNAKAQPPEPKPVPVPVPAPQIRRPVPRVGTPEELLFRDVKAFVAELNGENPFYGAARYVWGARTGYFGANEWQKWWLKSKHTVTLQPADIQIKKITATEAEITLTYQTLAQGSFALKFDFSPLDPEKLGNKLWQFVPQAPQDNEFLSNAPVRWAVWSLSQLPKALPSFRAAVYQDQLKVLGLGAMQFMQDYDERFAFLPEFQEEALAPYLKDPPLWIVPGTNEKFLFNGRLSGKNVAAVADPARTILFYDGADEKPKFRFNGKTAVCLADGHVELADAERFKAFRWE